MGGGSMSKREQKLDSVRCAAEIPTMKPIET